LQYKVYFLNIPTDEGWLYLAAIEDLFQRKIVDWSMDSHYNPPADTKCSEASSSEI